MCFSHGRNWISTFLDPVGDEVVGFFDGATLDGVCGAGMVVMMARDYCIHLCMSAGKGSNNRV